MMRKFLLAVVCLAFAAIASAVASDPVIPSYQSASVDPACSDLGTANTVTQDYYSAAVQRQSEAAAAYAQACEAVEALQGVMSQEDADAVAGLLDAISAYLEISGDLLETAADAMTAAAADVSASSDAYSQEDYDNAYLDACIGLGDLNVASDSAGMANGYCDQIDTAMSSLAAILATYQE